jgi:hypothetical protein
MKGYTEDSLWFDIEDISLFEIACQNKWDIQLKFVE